MPSAATRKCHIHPYPTNLFPNRFQRSKNAATKQQPKRDIPKRRLVALLQKPIWMCHILERHVSDVSPQT